MFYSYKGHGLHEGVHIQFGLYMNKTSINERQTDRQTGRERQSHKQTETDRQTETKIEIETETEAERERERERMFRSHHY